MLVADGPPGSRVVARFTRFDIELEAHCEWDSVDVYDGATAEPANAGAVVTAGHTGTGQLLKRSCGQESDLVFVSSGDALTIHFHSVGAHIQGNTEHRRPFTQPPAVGY